MKIDITKKEFQLAEILLGDVYYTFDDVGSYECSKCKEFIKKINDFNIALIYHQPAHPRIYQTIRYKVLCDKCFKAKMRKEKENQNKWEEEMEKELKEAKKQEYKVWKKNGTEHIERFDLYGTDIIETLKKKAKEKQGERTDILSTLRESKEHTGQGYQKSDKAVDTIYGKAHPNLCQISAKSEPLDTAPGKTASLNVERSEQKSVLQISDKQKPIDTKKETAKLAKVSHDTIHKIRKIQEKADEKTTQKNTSKTG